MLLMQRDMLGYSEREKEDTDMKKILSLLLVVLTTFTLSSCTLKLEDEYRIGGEVEQVSHIDVYNVETIEGDVLDILDTASPVYTIRDAEATGFVSELLSVDYGNKVYFPAPIDYAHIFSPGYVVFINYVDGDFDVYAEKGVYVHSGRLTADGASHYFYYPHSYLGDTPWSEFIEKYTNN